MKIRACAALALVACVVVPAPAAHAQPSAIDAVVEQYLAGTDVPGVAVTVTHGSAVVHAKGYGHTASGEPVTDRTVLATASVSKSFTALAVLRLVENGQVALDGPVQRYLPEFVMADPRAALITVRQLLDQTSGLSDASVGQFTRTQPATLQESVADFRGARLAAEPATRWEYYNPNYQIAARLVEVVSGQPFDSYLADRVFGPLGMGDSRTVATDRDLPPSARGHLRVLGQAVPVPEPTAFGAGSGGVLSTARDLAAWLIAQNGQGVVAPASLAAMHTPSAAAGGYALGWSVGTTPSGAPELSHGGDLFTATAYQAILPESGYGIAVMATTGLAHGDATALGEQLVALVDGGPVPPASGPSAVVVDAVLLGLAAIVLAAGLRGTIRARRWNATRTHRLARLAPLVVPPVLLALTPRIVGVLYRGRDVTWVQSLYLYPSFMIFLGAASAACAAVLVARLIPGLRHVSIGGTRRRPCRAGRP